MNKTPFSLEDPDYVKRIEGRLAYSVLVDDFSPPEPEDIIVMGSFSRTWRNKKHREIKRGKTEILGDRVDSPIAHARDYLMSCYAKRPCKAEQRRILRNKAMPIHVRPCLMQDASYVDIRGAWWNIMLMVGWNCEYYPGKWVGVGDPPSDFPLPFNKVARSSLITIARSSIIPVWKRGIVTQERIYNRIENLHIWGLTADILHLIARVAVDLFECRYVATDGFILPSRNADNLRSFIDTLGLETRVKWQGPAIVAGAGSYITAGNATIRNVNFKAISNIDYGIDPAWLVKKIGYCFLVTKSLQ